ncbi:polysaccharide lyase family protein [Thermogemmatispora onikobensis]|uniref:polysaccharide lyase family protein n=1 Tax=Thermogemmatispora onikobensis TaxID=732234 RepID=UPI00159EFEE7|nr:polysaccharide lyase family protein [Thermogemmatispora onikobensis]
MSGKRLRALLLPGALSRLLILFLVLGSLALVRTLPGLRGEPAHAASPVTLSVSGMSATIGNGIFTVKFNSSGTGYSLVWQGKELIGPAKGFYSSINGGTGFSPTQLTVVTNTSSLVDIAYISSWGELHYVVRSGVSGLYSYFLATGIGTVGEFRTLYRVDGSIFRTGYNGAETAIAFPTLSQIQSATVLQDSTYQLSDGTIYTKYDAATYLMSQDLLHGVYGNGYGVWLISPSHEYNNGGPLKQDLTVHVDSSNGDAVVLNMLISAHFGTPEVTIPNGKLFGPWFVYFNNGSISDAQAQATLQQQQWPYSWLSNPAYPLNRATVTGSLRLADGRPAAGAQITLAQPGGDVYAQGAGYIFTTVADASGNFTLRQVRPGSYSLYAWANGGSIGDITDQYELDNVNVTGTSTSLGTLTWTPVRYSILLWQIGTADRKAAEFRLGNLPRQYGLWNQVPANLTYTIGSSTPANNWYYAQTAVGTWNVNFSVSQSYSGDAHLTVALAGMTRTAAVTVRVNGTAIGSYPAYTNDAAIYRSANQSGYYHLMTFTFPASLLKIGTNTVAFAMTSVSSGGGAMYDTIKLEVGPQVTGGSTASPTPTPTAASSGSTCRVSYSVTSQWPGGFTASITLTNSGTTTINGWTLTFVFSAGQTVTQGWNATFSQQGSQVSASSLSYNATLAPGASTTLGFNGTWTTTNPAPASFTLNGQSCALS